MCNAKNHSYGCLCGFGGEGHLGRSHGRPDLSSLTGRVVYSDYDEDYCRPTRCPKCRAEVFFVRHNGGSVWFDELGSPWKKHPCFGDDQFSIRLRMELITELFSHEDPLTVEEPLFGVVIKALAVHPGVGGRISVRCSDGIIVEGEIKTNLDFAAIIGLFVIVVRRGSAYRFSKILGPPEKIVYRPRSILEFAAGPGFPGNVVGHTVLVNDLIGKVIGVLEGGRKFLFSVRGTKETKTFSADFFLKKAAARS